MRAGIFPGKHTQPGRFLSLTHTVDPVRSRSSDRGLHLGRKGLEGQEEGEKKDFLKQSQRQIQDKDQLKQRPQILGLERQEYYVLADL